jgi:CelD/BcsL family acetyltransferase involved in cellulose biosynthesis
VDLTLAPPVSQSNVIPVSESAVRIEVLEDWGAVEALAPEWNALLPESSADTIFLSWEWIRCWADVLGNEIRPLVVCARDSMGALIALAPLYRARLRLFHTVPYRVLRVMGDYPTGADYPDWIARRDCDDSVLPAMVQALCARGGWDCIWMSNMAGWTSSFDRLVAACRSRGLHCHTRARDFGWFELPSSKETYFRSLSKNKRQQLRAETKRIMERPTVEITRCDSEDQIPIFLEALFELHHRRWRERGEAGAFREQPQEEAFYRRFTRVAQRMGWLRLYGLRDAGDFKAVQIGYVYRGVFHQLQEGFDPEYLKGAGNVLRARLIEDCIAEGVGSYDFLGEMSEHKRRWLARERTGHDLVIGRFKLRNLPLFHGFWPSCRFMRQVSPPLGQAKRTGDVSVR